ncbi:L,D-transpeptidase family protein [Caulobacter soli]|uniref:L,D-transpeptidase family protein n=1 Tax=Caulobacter soli TaxID=2708539 RepID=UPI0013EDB43C|nr:L,D-transpeptidase family protein [Caulobacter soli]
MKSWTKRDALLGGALSLFSFSSALAQIQNSPVVRVPQQPASPPPTSVVLRSDQVDLLVRTLNQAHTHGFEPIAFAPDAILPQLNARDGGARQAGQAQLIALTLRYAKAVRTGRLTPDGFLTDWGLRPLPYDPGPDFVQAAAQDRLGPWLDSLPPPYTGYQTLRRGLATYRDLAAKGGWKPIAAGEALKLGATGDPRIAALEARLAVEDATVAVDKAAVFDEALQQALMRAQKRFGLNPDGGLGPATLTALNVPVERRIDQILANMERWRWLPQQLPADRIQVNIAAAVMSVFHDDAPNLTMRAVTGRPGDETPMLQSTIHSIVLNPPWNVPAGIAAKELWPKQRANPRYFANNDFIVIPTGDGGSRLQQKAGPKAALGLVKFDFDNPYGVYLHDTPSRSKFASFSRLASHGCVRLEKPIPLAKQLLATNPDWQPDVVDATIASGKTVRAQLGQPIAVFLLYWTAYMTPDGQMNFRDDPYGWDKVLVQRIAASGPGSA